MSVSNVLLSELSPQHPFVPMNYHFRALKIFRQSVSCLLLFLVCTAASVAQERTMGLMLNMPKAFEGYTLFAPLRSTTTYLVDMEGRLVHSWPGKTTPGQLSYLLEDGRLIRCEMLHNLSFRGGGGGGRIITRSWEGDVLWEFIYSNNHVQQHHDIEVLPNGNVLMIAWERKSRAEALAAGVDPQRVPDYGLFPDHIVEVRPEGADSGIIVWEWHLWDHLIQDVDSTKANYGVVEEHPELINLNAQLTATDTRQPDWWHSNAIDYNADLDQILISVRNYSEIWIIDHSTTTEEAAGHTGGRYGRGGDLLYRYGNVRAYHPHAPTLRQLYVQHDARWIEEGYPGAGNILIFSNGDQTMGSYSSVLEIAPPVDSSGHYRIGGNGVYGSETPVWNYTAPNPRDFFAVNISGASRLPNGNTLICNGPVGEFFEVTPAGETVWRYINPVTHDGPLTQGEEIPGSEFSKDNLVFRCTRFDAGYAGLQGRDLTSGDPIELYPTGIGSGGNPSDADASMAAQPTLAPNYPNPFTVSTIMRFSLPREEAVRLEILDALGRCVSVLLDARMTVGSHALRWNPDPALPAGMYLLRMRAGTHQVTRTMLLRR